jgi:hypothetical protein
MNSTLDIIFDSYQNKSGSFAYDQAFPEDEEYEFFSSFTKNGFPTSLREDDEAAITSGATFHEDTILDLDYDSDHVTSSVPLENSELLSHEDLLIPTSSTSACYNDASPAVITSDEDASKELKDTIMDTDFFTDISDESLDLESHGEVSCAALPPSGRLLSNIFSQEACKQDNVQSIFKKSVSALVDEPNQVFKRLPEFSCDDKNFLQPLLHRSNDIAKDQSYPTSTTPAAMGQEMFCLPTTNLSPSTTAVLSWETDLSESISFDFPSDPLSDLSSSFSFEDKSQEDRRQSKKNVTTKTSTPKEPNRFEGEQILLNSNLEASTKELVTEFTNNVINQLEVVSFSQRDRKGNRTKVPLGFPGFACRHCKGLEGRTGRYFPSSVKTFADSKKTLFAVNRHLLQCNHCPEDTKALIRQSFEDHMKYLDEGKGAKKRHGSQRAYYRKIWGTMHPKGNALNSSQIC